jgi:hypothetical protein
VDARSRMAPRSTPLVVAAFECPSISDLKISGRQVIGRALRRQSYGLNEVRPGAAHLISSTVFQY